jgi:hypothetical protein
MKEKPKKGIKLTINEIKNLVVNEELKLPKYAAPIINLANRFAQATRPKIVGQMSELVKECPYRDFEGWKRWYLNEYPGAIESATDMITEMLKNFKDVIDKLDKEIVRKWVEDLVLVKTFVGLRVQEPILKFFGHLLGVKYRLATPEEESKGIDGCIGGYNVSIKPVTYKEKEGIAEERPIGDVVIFYEKDIKNNIIITEIRSLSEKGKYFIDKLRRSFSGTPLYDFD